MKEEKKIELAEKFFKSFKKLRDYDMYILLRTNWLLGGMVIDTDKKETVYGDRVMFKVVTPDGRIAYEYADKALGGTIESCTFRFKDAPFILTERKVPSMMDDPRLFYPIITGIEARSWSEMVADVKMKHEVIHHQAYIIHNLNTEKEVLEAKVSALGSELRRIKEEYKLAEQENAELKRALAQIKKIAETAIRENITKDAMIKRIMEVLDSMSTKVVQTPHEMVEDVLNQMVRVKGKMEYVSGNGELESIRKEVSKLSQLEERLRSLEQKLEELKSHGGGG